MNGRDYYTVLTAVFGAIAGVALGFQCNIEPALLGGIGTIVGVALGGVMWRLFAWLMRPANRRHL